MKPLKTAGILAVVLLALGGLATWDEWKTKKDETAKEAKNRLVQFDLSTVTHFEFENAGNELRDGETALPEKLSLKANKSNGIWKITAPIETQGDTRAIENFLSTLRDYKYEKTAAETVEDRAKFGLENPRRRIAIFSGEKLISEVLVGSNAPIGYHVYSAVAQENQVYIGSQYLAVATNKTLFDLRDKTLVNVELDKLKSFSLRSFASNPLTIERSAEKYIFAGEEAIEADAQAVKIFFEDLERATVQEAIDSPSTELSKSMAAATEAFLTWSLVDGTSHRFSAVELGKDIYVRRDSQTTVYRLAPEFKGKFSQKSADFRNRRIFQFSSSAITAVEINGKLFKKIGDDWLDSQAAESFSESGTYTGPAGMRPAGNVKVRSLVVDLEFARAVEFLETSENSRQLTSTAPMHQVKLSFEKDTPNSELIIDLWPETAAGANTSSNSGKTWLLRRSGAPGIVRVNKSLVETLLPASESSLNGESPMPSAIARDGALGRENMDVAIPESVDDGAKNGVSGIKN